MLRILLAAVLVVLLTGVPSQADEAGDAEAGSQTYAENCAQCHGENLRHEGQPGADLRQLGQNDRAKFDKMVQEGRGQMPPWRGVLSDEQLTQIWTYIMVNSR